MDGYESYRLQPGPLTLENLKALHGANYFSGGPTIILRLDLGEYDEGFILTESWAWITAKSMSTAAAWPWVTPLAPAAAAS